MTLKILGLLTSLVAAVSACGGKKDGADDEVTGLPVQGSSFKGMYLATVNTDQSIKSARVYRYEFASGILKSVLPAEIGVPALYADGSRIILFNRHTSGTSLRLLDATSPDAAPAAAQELAGVTTGDPWDAIPLISGSSLLLASPHGGKLQQLDYATAKVTDVDAAGISANRFRPVGLWRADAKVMALHSGTDPETMAADSSQQVYRLSVQDDGSPTFVDMDSSTTAIDGLAIGPSNPTGFVHRSTGSAMIVGLCQETMPDCVAGAAKVTMAKSEDLATYDPAAFGYRFHNQIIDGPDAASVYAHVQSTADDTYQLITIDAATAAAKTIHTFEDERLYGVSHDASSGTLFVGGKDGLMGTLTLIRGGKVQGTFELDGVPYQAVFY